jgi:putative transcriptional regulator
MSKIHDIVKIKTNGVLPEKGKILISEPFLLDYYFKRSVVLLAEHNDQGTFGLILNKPVDIRFNDVFPDYPEFEAGIFIGGPVQTESIFFIHTLGDLVEDSIEILDGLYWGGNINIIKEMIAQEQVRPDQVKFFAGYSGWVMKQLDGELSRNSWVVSQIRMEQIMQEDTTNLWSKLLTGMGGDFAWWPKFPEDPGNN